MPFKPKIVVGTDLTPASEHAVERATELAREHHATLHVVHAKTRLPRALVRTFHAEGDGHERIALARVISTLRRGGHKATGHLVDGGAAPALRKLARELEATLVVVGARKSSVADAILGSTAERIVSATGAPVLLVRERPTRVHRRVVVAIDVDSDVRRAVDAARFAAPEATLSLLHACHGAFETKLQLQGVGPHEIARYRAHVRAEAAAALEDVLDRADVERNALQLLYGERRRVLAAAVKRGELLVLDRGTSMARRLLLGSVTRWVVEHTATDVLIV
jgi:nucleotide-binding universal stress UspA family protein